MTHLIFPSPLLSLCFLSHFLLTNTLTASLIVLSLSSVLFSCSVSVSLVSFILLSLSVFLNHFLALSLTHSGSFILSFLHPCPIPITLLLNLIVFSLLIIFSPFLLLPTLSPSHSLLSLFVYLALHLSFPLSKFVYCFRCI